MPHSHFQLHKEGRPFRIIVVDDNEVLLKAWQKMLQRAGYDGLTTTEPEEALEEIEYRGADLLICDIVMPHMDGFELIQRLEKMPRLSGAQQPKVVLTTGYVCDFKRLRLDVGDQDVHVLLKPYNSIEEVLHFIERVLKSDETLLQQEENPAQTLDDARVHLWSL